MMKWRGSTGKTASNMSLSVNAVKASRMALGAPKVKQDILLW
jgi:hypothetical protein